MGWKYFRMVNLFERSNENKLWIKNKVKEKRKEEIIMTERMKEIVAEALNVEIETLKEDTSFKEDLGADSLDLFELVMAFEEEFGVEIPSEDLEKINPSKLSPRLLPDYYECYRHLYNELGEYIQNNIDIDSIEIKNTIEKRGMGNKRDSFVRLNIRGVVSHKISTFQLLVAGDTIVNFEDINIQAFERVGGKQKKLCARIADNGQDSLLKQVVVSYGKVKSPGSIVDLMIEWCWPNMLNITDCDYTTLPNFLAGTVKHLKMSLECKEDIGFKSASIYKYKVGMDKAQLILDVDMSEITDTISYEEDNPLMNSTYILYYEVAR